MYLQQSDKFMPQWNALLFNVASQAGYLVLGWIHTF
jgi:hypothetical protein